METQGTNHALAFGSYLRSERELRQIPLAEVAAVTKIPLRTLQHLEDGQWHELPPAVFVRGFVRSYARCLRIGEGDAAQRFDQACGKNRPREANQRYRAPHPVETRANRRETDGDFWGRRRFELALLVIIVVILATITLSLLWRRGGHTDIQAQVVPQSAPAAPSSAEGTRA